MHIPSQEQTADQQLASKRNQPITAAPLTPSPPGHHDRQFWQAVGLWGVFFVTLVLLNGTIPFLLGRNVHAWTFSPAKGFLINLLGYAGLCLVGPLLLSKGWKSVRRPGFLGPLVGAILSILLRGFWPLLAALVVVVIGSLHWRFDLSDLGVRSRGWKGDTFAILVLGVLSLIPPLLVAGPHTLTPEAAFLAGMDRLATNPASTVENLFYFGFLTERLVSKIGKWLTPLLIGALYTAHEISNPEYWYGGTSFALIFVGITLVAAVYVWRRSLVVTWLWDGLSRFVSCLIS